MIFDSNGMDEFAPEPGPSAARASAPSVARLSDVVRVVSFHWDEAVAVVEELCAALVPAHGGELPVPGLEDIFIGEAGTVTVGDQGRGERVPSAAGRILHSLLSSTEVPVGLRLFVAQSSAPETYRSIREFATGLAYFGKPGRTNLIRAVYQRYAPMAAADAFLSPHTPSWPQQRPLEALAATTPSVVPVTVLKSRELPFWFAPAAVAGAGVFVVGAALWAWSGGAFGGRREDSGLTVQAATVAEVPEAQDPVVATAPAAVALAPRSARSTGFAAPRREAGVANQPGMARLGGGRSGASGPEGASRSAGTVSSLGADARRKASASEPEVSVSLPIGAPAASEAGATVYSGLDTDVQPPVLLFPQLPSPLFAAEAGAAVNRMELVVAPDGTVERVRLLEAPTRMPDMMLLSGAKMWKFSPAMKDGEAVRYRTVVTWTGFP